MLINGNKYLEMGIRQLKQLSILDPKPTHILYGLGFMDPEITSDPSVHALIKKYLHAASVRIRPVNESSKTAITCSRLIQS